MEIKKELINSTLVISLTGRLDTTTAPDLEEVLDSSLEGITELELNMAGVPYVSSAGLRVVIAAMKRMKKQGPMKVTHVCDDVYEVLDITGLLDFLTVEKENS